MRFAFVGVLAKELLIFHGEMLRTLAAAGHEVVAIAPDRDERVEAVLGGYGVRFQVVPLTRAGLNPLRDAITAITLTRIFRALRPDVVLVSAAKPVIYGSVAARLAGVPMRSAMITGVGSVLGGGPGIRMTVLSRLLRTLYAVASRQWDVVFFQNPDDEAMFRSLGLLRRRHRIVRINGTGVDLDWFEPSPMPPRPTTFLMVSRLIRDKGVMEYIEAARIVHRVHPDVRFHLLGPLDPNPSAITAHELAEIRREGVVDYLGVTLDVRPYWSAAHVCVLPSYHEGTPVSVLEAMAMGRPVIATDVPGCRETVEPGRNGRLVTVRDPGAVAAAMQEAIAEPDRWDAMGQASREIAVARYDVHAVNRVIFDALEIESPDPDGQP